MTAWWIGYAAFAVAFTYHMPTHDYYHLPYVAIVALGAAATLERLRAWLESRVTAGHVSRAPAPLPRRSRSGERYRRGRV